MKESRDVGLALECCARGAAGCGACPYHGRTSCHRELLRDAAVIVREEGEKPEVYERQVKASISEQLAHFLVLKHKQPEFVRVIVRYPTAQNTVEMEIFELEIKMPGVGE